MGVEGVFHPVITVSSLEVALEFYRDLLGLEVDFEGRHDPAAISELFAVEAPDVKAMTLVCADNSEIEFVEWANPAGRQVADRHMADVGVAAVNLRVTGMEELVDELDRAGYRDHSPIVPQVLPDGSTIKVTACRGPDRTMVILVELPPGRSSLAPVSD